MSRIFALAVILMLASIAPETPALAFEGQDLGRDGLWKVVHGLCAPMRKYTGLPTPCLAVDLDRGFASLRAPDDVTHIIVTPLAKIPGVESPDLLRKDAPNFWSAAWSQRQFVIDAAPRRPAHAELGMAVNAAGSRSQDLLHIHVDCVAPRVAAALSRLGPLGSNWFTLDLSRFDDVYRARKLTADQLNQNIFRLVQLDVPGAAANMADVTIAVIGLRQSDGEDAFLLLAATDGGHAEDLLDHDCRQLAMAAKPF